MQVPKDSTLTLKWDTDNATGVRIEGLDGSFGPSGVQQISTEDKSYMLVPLGDAGAEGPSWSMEIHTHEPGQVVSPHTEVNSGVAKIVSFQAMAGGVPVDSARVGDTIELVLLASDGCESAKINDKKVELSDAADGHKTVSVKVTLTADMKGSFSAEVSQSGAVADSAAVSVEIEQTQPGATFRLQLLDEAGEAMPPGTRYRLTYQGQVREGALGEGGVLEEQEFPVKDGKVTVEWVGVAPATMVAPPARKGGAS